MKGKRRGMRKPSWRAHVTPLFALVTAATLGGILLLVSLLVVSACGRGEPAAQTVERMSIVVQTWVGYGPLYLAADKGFFAEEGLELAFVHEELDAARRDAFKAGMLDAEAGTVDQLVSKRAFGAPVVAVAELDISLGGDAIVADESIRRLSDLVGKRVAFARDDVGETFLAFLLHESGLSLEQITIVPKAPDKAAQAFLDGTVDAAVTWEPWVTKALARKGAHVLASTKDEPGIIVDVLNVREDIVRDNPLLVKKLVRGWYKAVAYYRAHPDEASGIIAPYFGLTPEQYRTAVGGLHWPTYEEARADFGTQDRPGRLFALFDTIALIKQDSRRIPSSPGAAQAFRPHILQTLYDSEQATE